MRYAMPSSCGWHLSSGRPVFRWDQSSRPIRFVVKFSLGQPPMRFGSWGPLPLPSAVSMAARILSASSLSYARSAVDRDSPPSPIDWDEAHPSSRLREYFTQLRRPESPYWTALVSSWMMTPGSATAAGPRAPETAGGSPAALAHRATGSESRATGCSVPG